MFSLTLCSTTSNIASIYGTGDGNSITLYLNGFRHNSISTISTSSFLVGISDANSPFDMMYDSETIVSGQVILLLQSSQ